jgi:autotransporter passenger strand-loop-strand repeat protein
MGDTVEDFARETVSSGGSANDTVLSGASGIGNGVLALAGGTASGTVIRSLGEAVISAGGVASGSLVHSGGTQAISAGGVARGTTVLSGGYQCVSSGGSSIHAVIESGGSEAVSGVASGTTVLGGGTESVLSGGTSLQADIGQGAYQALSAGGLASEAVVGSGAVQAVNGTASQSRILSGGSQIVSGGAVETTLSSGATQILFGVASGTVVAGGTELVFAAAETLGTVLRSGGTEQLIAGGVSSDTILSRGGFELVSGRGTALGSVVESGGYLAVSAGSVANGAEVSRGGQTVISAFAFGFYTTLSSGGTEFVLSDGVTSDTTIDSGGTEAVSSAGTSLDATVRSGGFSYVYAGGTAVGITVSAGGLEAVASGATTYDTTVAGGRLVLNPDAAATGSIGFSGTGGVVDILAATAVPPLATQIQGFGPEDFIDLSFVTYDAGADSYVVSGDTVTINAGDGHYAFNIAGAMSGGFDLRSNGDGKVQLTVCYYPGTLIRTPAGDVAVEALGLGDDVMTADGRALPVRWIGRNTVSTRRADPLRVLPIRIRAGALDEGRPERDLLVSPEHALLIDDILVQAGALVNGLSIIRERNVPETFTYYHVEFAEHVLILAEGTPAESFVDSLHRSAFDNWAEHVALYGPAPIAEMAYPRAQSHRQVPRDIHQRLMARCRAITRPAA